MPHATIAPPDAPHTEAAVAPTYDPARAKRLIREKKVTGEYHVTDSLDLSGCDLSGVTLPASVTDSLDLSGCDLSGVTLPASVGGSLDLSGCDLSGVTLPASVTGSLDLRGCDLSGATLPASVGGWLYLNGARNLSTPSTFWTEQGEATARRCLAISDYALIQLGDGYVAGCRTFTSAKAALAHWDRPSRTDDRAKAFTAAIKLVEASK